MRRRTRHTEGGEALTSAITGTTDDMRASEAPAGVSPFWCTLWTASHCERQVEEHLASKGFEVFLPTVDIWSRRKTGRRLIQTPMFPGYLFLRHAMDKTSYVEVRKTRGLVRILGERWDRLATVPDVEVAAIRQVVASRLRTLPHAYLREGRQVWIRRGPLAGVTGILRQVDAGKGLLVLSVNLLQRSVAVVVDCTDVDGCC